MTSEPRDPHDSERGVGVERELIGGAERREIVIVAYDPSWPERFTIQRDRIRRALGGRATSIDHIGSTSVPGLAAKPIIDIQVSVPEVDDEEAYVPDLEHAAYELRVREPAHRMFRTPGRDVHVHVCSSGSGWEARHLLFRDWLRHDAVDRARYQAAKQELARSEWPTMDDYADAKTAVVDEIMTRARQWAGGNVSAPRR